MKYNEGDIVEFEGMRLKLVKADDTCKGCELTHYFMKYCARAIALFGNFKFIKVEDIETK